MTKELTAILDELRKEIKSELKDFKDSFDRDLRKDLRDIKMSLNFINQMYEELKEQVKVSLAENRAVKEENTKLKLTCDELTKQVKDNALRTIRLEQYSRNANIEMKNIPVQPNDSLPGILAKIG